MNLSDVVGQMLKEGVTPATRGRLEHSVGQNGLGSLGDVLGGMLGGAGGQQAGAGGLGGLLGSLGQAMSADSGVGGMSRGQVGGIGALAGAILGGGGSSVKGAIGGSAMALLGTLALSALRDWQAQSAGQVQSAAQAGGQGGAAGAAALSQGEIHQMVSPDTAELCLRGMIEAVKADGEVTADEIDRIVGKVGKDGAADAEKQFVAEHLRCPPDAASLIAAIPNREVGAQVYAAALMAIEVDTPAERDFLARLATGAGLDAETVGRLHAMVGAPPAIA